MVVVGQGQVAREIDFYAMPFADSDGRKNIQKPVEDLRGGLRGALPESLAETIRAGLGKDTPCSCFGDRADGADGERSAEDALVMVVDLIAEAALATMVEPFKLVEADGIAVGHEHPVDDHSETRLAEGFDLASFAENLAACQPQQMLAVARIDVRCHQTCNGAGTRSVETVEQYSFEDGSLEQHVGFPCRRCGASRSGGRGSNLLFVGFRLRGTRGGGRDGGGWHSSRDRESGLHLPQEVREVRSLGIGSFR